MTVNTTVTSARFTGDGSTTAFPCSYPIIDATHVRVTVDDVVKTLNTDYTVSGAGGASFTVTFTTAPASGARIAVLRNVPFDQQTDYVENDTFPAATHEQALDKLTMEVQQLAEELDRTPKLPESSTLTDPALPTPVAGKLLGWNSAATDLENKDVVSGSVTLPLVVADGGTGGTTAASARTNLEVAGKDNTSATTSPGVSDDSTAGYGPGSLWVNTIDDEVWVCVDAAAGAASWVQQGGRLLKVTNYAASATWTPDPKTRYIMVEVWGAGGAGGGTPATAAGEAAEGAGGSSGGYGIKFLERSALGATETVTVGQGGTGVSGANGNDGASSSFGTHVTATGGQGGTAGVAVSGNGSAISNAPGTCSGGNLNLSGGYGGYGRVVNGSVTASCMGAAAPRGGGQVRPIINSSGLAGRNPGGGGSGAVAGASHGAEAGGNGADGRILVWEFS